MAALRESVRLSSGFKMPLLGLGTWTMEKGQNAVDMALEAGYRHIDTAWIYQNEEQVGTSIASWIEKDPAKNKREDLFVVTKLPANCMDAKLVERILKKSLAKLKLSYVDLYLVHSPLGVKNSGNDEDLFPIKDGKIMLDNGTDLIAIWKAMEAIAEKGLAKSIGVSNYSIAQMKKTLAIAKIPPAVNQIECHLRYQQKETIKFCKDNNIVVTSYGSLGSPGRKNRESLIGESNFPDFLEHPLVELVANNHKVTTAQVALKFWVQQEVVVIPKSSKPLRITANSKLFGWNLSDLELSALKTLDLGLPGKSFVVKSDSPLREHPEFHED